MEKLRYVPPELKRLADIQPVQETDDEALPWGESLPYAGAPRAEGDTRPRVYLYCFHHTHTTWLGRALHEDGTELWTRRSSSLSFLKSDLRRGSTIPQEYPDCVVEWVDDANSHVGLREALIRRAAKEGK